MRKIQIMMCMVLMCTGLAACGKEAELKTTAVEKPPIEAATEAEEETVRVCVLYGSEEMLGKELGKDMAGAEIDTVFFDQKTGGEDAFAEICEADYDLVIGAEAGFADFVSIYAKDYPQTKFIVMDAVVDGENVLSVNISQKEGYYLAGAIAAAVADPNMAAEKKTDAETDAEAEVNTDAEAEVNTDAEAEANTEAEANAKQNTEAKAENEIEKLPVIGWVNSVDIPVFREWYTAYVQGAKYMNPEVQVLWDVTGIWEDSEEGNVHMEGQMEQGAKAVMYVPFDILNPASDSMNQSSLYAPDGKTLVSVKRTPERIIEKMIQEMILGTLETGMERTAAMSDGAVELVYGDALTELLKETEAGRLAAWIAEAEEKIAAGEIVLEAVLSVATESDALVP